MMPLGPKQAAPQRLRQRQRHMQTVHRPQHHPHHARSTPLSLLYHTSPTRPRLLAIVASNHCPLTTSWTARSDSDITTTTTRLRLHTTLHSPHGLDHGRLLSPPAYYIPNTPWPIYHLALVSLLASSSAYCQHASSPSASHSSASRTCSKTPRKTMRHVVRHTAVGDGKSACHYSCLPTSSARLSRSPLYLCHCSARCKHLDSYSTVSWRV